MSETSGEAEPKPRRRILDWSAMVILCVVVAAGTYVYWRDGADRFYEVARHDAALFGDMMPKVLAGSLIAAFLTVLLPREVVGRWVGAESGLKGLLIAMLAGVIMPGGPYTIFPVAGAFVAVGADVAAAITLITSWTLIGLNRIVVWEMPFLGIDFVGWRVLLSLPLPIIAGLSARIIARAIKHKRAA